MNARIAEALLVGVTLVGVAACSEHEQPYPAPTPVVTSLKIRGKTSSEGVNEWRGAWLGMVPGETAQLTAIAGYSDTPERDVTAETVWTTDQSTPAGVVGIVAPGVVRANGSGWATVIVRFGSARTSNAQSQALVRVAPEGAFLLDIGVDDGSSTVNEARVEVTSRVGTFDAITDLWGIVTLPATGDTVVQVERAGYMTLRRSMMVNNDQGVICTLQRAAAARSAASLR
jgi:hypothetical protein